MQSTHRALDQGPHPGAPSRARRRRKARATRRSGADRAAQPRGTGTRPASRCLPHQVTPTAVERTLWQLVGGVTDERAVLAGLLAMRAAAHDDPVLLDGLQA